MRVFQNVEEKIQHPQSSVTDILKFLWDDNPWTYHRNIEALDELISLIQLIQIDPDSLIDYLEVNQDALRKINEKAGLVIALSYPELDLKLLRQANALLDISEETFFKLCVEAGNIGLVKLLADAHQGTTWVQKLIESDNYNPLRCAVLRGHLSILYYFGQHVPELKTREMIQTHLHNVFMEVIRKGDLPILKYLMEHASDKISEIFATSGSMIVGLAVSNGDLPILQYLATQFPNKFPDTVRANDYDVFRWAASEGYLSILNYLIEQVPNELSAMIEAHDYEAFRRAATYGHQSILDYLVEHAPEKLQEMIAASNYQAFQRAGANGHFEVLQYLVRQAPDELQAMIRAGNYYALQWASIHGHKEVIAFLLADIEGFTFAESHMSQFEHHIAPFIAKQLDELRNKIACSDTPMEWSLEESKKLFYLARALIRRQASLEVLRMVLDIPAVKELVHQAITPGESNELLRLAARVDNQDACEYLLTIPAVFREAEANNFYLDEYQGRTDLRLIAQDRESSMTALSEEEKQRLDTLKKHYLEKDKEHFDQILEELRALLIQRYEKDPATITCTNSDGKTVNLSLPCSWEEFNALSLAEEERAAALEAYYKNKNHTAWRFLAKPNPWMHPDALFVNRNQSGQWSCFGNYKDLIAVLFLAAKDESMAGTDGYSVDDRLTQFVDELALIGRAHNWDKETIKRQEYDDLAADRPSCYLGIKRRLFQSVQGHPLLKQLTADIVQQELREFVWAHFQKVITRDNFQLLSTIWEKSISMEGFNTEENDLLAKINISKEDQTNWLQTLRNRHGEQINRYEVFLLRKLNLSDQDNHFIRFSYLGLDQLFKDFSCRKENAKTGFDATEKQLSKETNTAMRFFSIDSNSSNNNSKLPSQTSHLLH